MKRLAAILLLGIFGFNWIGYQLVTAYLESRSDKQLETRLDDNRYDDSQLLSIKVPSHLSYSSPSLQFERVDGQVEVKGILYKYVKRRIFNDSLELLCIPNQAAMNLRAAKDNFFQLVNDLSHNGQGKKTDPHPGSSKGSSSPEYIAINSLFAIGNPHFAISLSYAPCDAAALPSTDRIIAGQPPDPSFLTA